MYSVTLSLSNRVLEFSSENCVFADQSSLGFPPHLLFMHVYLFHLFFLNSILGLILQAPAGTDAQAVL